MMVLVGLGLWQAGARAQGAAPAGGGGGEGLTLLGAIQETLRLHPEVISADAEVEARTADVLGARAIFDPVASARLEHRRTNTPLLPGERLATETKLVEDATTLALAGTSVLPTGTTFTPAVGITRLDQRRAPGGGLMPGLMGKPAQRASVALGIAQPLLRGRGELGTASELMAARHEREAAVHLRAHVGQQAALRTVGAYWQLVAAGEEVAILTEAEVGARKLLDETRQLVQGNQRPAADLVQLEGNLYNRTLAVAAAQRARKNALYSLRLAMGLGGQGATPEWRPTSAMPAPAPVAAVGAGDRVVESREDVRAARETVDGARALYAGAERNALPQLDLGVSLGYAGATDEDGVGPFLGTLGNDVAGLNAGASLTLGLPIRNDARRAVRDRRSAELKQRAAVLEDTRRQVLIGVESALEELRLSAQALAAAEQAAKRYSRAIEDERTKLRAGLSTVIDVVLTQDNLTQAQLALTRSRLDYAVTLARLRFETGELPGTEAEAASRVNLVLDAAGVSDGRR
jgi:outer membrane protein TolC